MTTYFISRHPGARDWAAAEGLQVDAQIDHLDPSTIRSGDVVIGTLPINLISEVCARGGRYLHLSLDLTANLRGHELSAEDMRQCNARLEEYRALPVPKPTTDHSTEKHLFIVVATGQRVANLPPILEYGNRGDAVLWIESPEAIKGQWNIGVNQVLTKEGFDIVQPSLQAKDINNPVEMRWIAENFLLSDGKYYRDWKPVIVANGGLKLTPIGLLEAWGVFQPIVLYGNDRPTMLRVFPKGLIDSPQDQLYQRHHLDLPDILLASLHGLYEPKPAKQLWPNHPQLPPVSGYGTDPDFTNKIHQEHYEYGQQARKSQNVAIPSTDLGILLEDAVEQRLLNWLNKSTSAQKVIQSVWRNVSICQKATPDREMAEWDIVLVLKNGILLYIECKAFEGSASQKELDARSVNLRQASSNLALMIVCTPIYTKFQNEKWFKGLHQLKNRVESVMGRLSFLPFTLPDQPETYTVKLGRRKESGTCPSFEDALIQILQPYISSQGE